MVSLSIILSFLLFIGLLVWKIIPAVRQLLLKQIKAIKTEHKKILAENKSAAYALEQIQKEITDFDQLARSMQKETEAELHAIEGEADSMVEQRQALQEKKKEYIEEALKKKQDLFQKKLYVKGLYTAVESELKKSKHNPLPLPKK